MFKKGLALLSVLTILGANSEYQEWLKSQSNEYNAYKKSLDEEFSEMLKKDWELFKSLMDPGPFEKPKPTVMPKVKEAVKIPKKDIEKSPKAKVKPIKKEEIVIPSNKPKIADIEIVLDENTPSGKVIGKLPIISSGETPITLVDLFDPQVRNLSQEFEILTNGNIKIKKGAKIDFEKRSVFKLMTIATNSYGDSNRADVIIKINNLKNEVLPKLENLNIEVKEDQKGGTFVGEVKVSNLKNLDSEITSFVLSGKGSNSFTIDKEGKVYTSKDTVLDYESIRSYLLKVYAVNKAGNSKGSNISINIKDIVEKETKKEKVVKVEYKVLPKLMPQEIEFAENLKSESILGKIKISNFKELDSEVTKYHLSGKGSENFYIDNKGNIKLSKNKSIDYENIDTYELKVSAVNKAGNSDSVDIVIYVNNTPEHKPKLDNFKAIVNEDANTKDIVGILNFDRGDSQIKEFKLFDKNGNGSDLFGISKNGLIFIKDSSLLNYEKSPKYNFSAIAVNGAGKSNISKVTIDIKKKVDKRYTKVDVEFYSQKLEIYYDKKSKFRLNKIDKNSIRAYWDKISKTKHKYLLDQLEKTAQKLNLNDWAKYQLVFKTGQSIYKDDNVANLFTWFVLVKMGYDTKVGYNKNKVYLLSTMNHKLFQIAFFKLKGKKYYVLTPNGRVGKVGKIYTYSGNYPKANDKLSFEMENDIKLYTNLKRKNLEFEYYGKMHKIATSYSKDLVDFYKTFPQSDYNIYFGTKNSAPLSNSILRQLQVLVKGKSELEAVNILLRFTQTAFKYKTDQKQFTYEKVMFPEETVFYPYSDCEDRSIMFSFLVKNLLGLDVVGVKYPDHLATAVEFSSSVSGDGFRYKGKKYIISDPTYINANAGMAMPQYKQSKFEVISLQ